MTRSIFAAASLIALAACSPSANDSEAPTGDTSQPATEDAGAQSREDDIRHFLLQEYPEAAPMRYALAWNDLDGDGAEEAIVHLATPYFCGSGGCNTIILTPAGPMWRKVGEISVSRTPVTVMESASNGWKDITVAIAGGGGEAGTALLKFDGEAYPSNPTVPPAETTAQSGTVLIAEEPEFIELEAQTASGG